MELEVIICKTRLSQTSRVHNNDLDALPQVKIPYWTHEQTKL